MIRWFWSCAGRLGRSLKIVREIISYIFTLAFLAFPLGFGGILLFKAETSIPKWFKFSIASVVVCYFCVLFSVWSIDWHYKYELDKFDLDRNGMFSGEELTPEMDKAMKNLTNDTGRTFAPITGAIIAPIYNGFWLTIFGGLTCIRNRIKTKREQALVTKRLPAQ